MQQTCQIEIKYPSDRTTVLTIAHQTPEWARVIERGAGTLCFAIWVAGSFAASYAAYHTAFAITIPEQIVIVALLSGFAFAIGKAIELLIVAAWRNGHGPQAFVYVKISQDAVRIGNGISTIHAARVADAKFTCLQHREGRFEQRAEQRVGLLVGYAFRDAWEVWLQMGRRFERIAAVSGEANARAIVRHLQEADVRAVRGDKQQQALTRSSENRVRV